MANAKGGGSGFRSLFTQRYPGKPIYRADHVGLNFEHVFNGAAADKGMSMFTPRKDFCELLPRSDGAVTLRWPAERSSWNLDCAMTFSFADDAIDLAFEVTPRTSRFPLGYVAFMWASYLNRTRERCIHFIGRDGARTGWMTFGGDLADGFEKGTVSFDGVPDLPYEKEAQTLNLIEHPTRKFTKPFYCGLIDGDNDLATSDDTLAYIMMFDRSAPIRFAVWNFIKDSRGNPDPHSPAWDWQFVIRDPQPGATYRYRARVVIKPFVSLEDVEAEYEKWRATR
ncbi:MAG: hypothetical protein FJ399_19860 [Verrucomicrobia bacterium]|nr:hypothetical protein [Verrucomicrobiota bacterium]